MPQKNYISHYENLKSKWSDNEKKLQKKLWQRHGEALSWLVHQSQNVAASSAAGFLLLASAPSPLTPVVSNAVQNASIHSPLNRAFLISDLYNKLPKDVGPLTPEQDERVAAILSARFGLSVTDEMNNKRLNTTYGLIGQEQHLIRYPGDSIDTHFDTQDEASTFSQYGVAPGLGAYGYFASSKAGMTEIEKQREQWYIAVQTWLSPGYNENVKDYNTFFQYRKVLVVNPQNGKAVVADIADAGPAVFTGKQYGGSPRVMRYLERYDGAQRGSVLIFFIDDPDNKVPFGPIEIQ